LFNSFSKIHDAPFIKVKQDIFTILSVFFAFLLMFNETVA